MRIRGRLLPLVASSILLAAPVHAKDWCFNSTSPANPAPPENPDIIIVAQGFKTPKKGKCQVINGFEIATYSQTFPRPVSASACLDSTGTTLHLGAIVHVSAGGDPPFTHLPQLFVEMIIPYPGLAGGRLHLRFGNAPTTTLGRTDVFAGPCGFAFPIP